MLLVVLQLPLEDTSTDELIQVMLAMLKLPVEHQATSVGIFLPIRDLSQIRSHISLIDLHSILMLTA